MSYKEVFCIIVRFVKGPYPPHVPLRILQIEEKLAVYNSEVDRGVLHTSDYDVKMELFQKEYTSYYRGEVEAVKRDLDRVFSLFKWGKST